jgi:hypothetical protein
MTDLAFAVFAIVECSTKRASLTTGFAEYLTDLMCTPKVPVDAETRLRLQVNTPVTLWEFHLQDNPDIKAGDKFIVDSVEYPVKTVEPYTWLPSGDTRLRVIVEDTRN